MMENPVAREPVAGIAAPRGLSYAALLVGVVLLSLLVAAQGVHQVVAALGVAGWGLVWLAVFHVVPMWADAMGWRRLVGAQERPAVGTMLWGRWIGESVNQLLPAMQVGGNIVKARLLAWHGIDPVDAAASVVADVTMLFATQVLFTLLGVLALVTLIDGSNLGMTAGLGVAAMATAALGFYRAQQRGVIRGVARVAERIGRGSDLSAVTHGAQALEAAVGRAYRNRAALLGAAGWHLAGWIAGTGEVWLALRLLGHPTGLLEAFLLESLGQAVRAAGFLIPGALGVQEGGLLALGRLVGVPPEMALALSLAKRARELMLGIPGLVSWQLALVGRAPTTAPRLPGNTARAVLPRRAPAVIRGVNAAGRPLAEAIRLDADALLERARRRTGLADFGGTAFIEPLRRLLASYEADADLSLLGRLAARNDTTRLLVNRLRIEEDRRRHPAIAAERIVRPIFVTGLPRTGTTFLHGILACDPGSRAPLGWDTMYPSPPPDGSRLDPRIAKAAFQMSWLERLAPGFEAIHPLGALVPQECLVITSHAFMSFQFQTSHRVTSYQAWLEDQDQDPAYAYHRRMLQHLQWKRPTGHWLLKAPAHLFGMAAIFATYPDAGVVFTHRDPLEVAPSLASLTCTLRRAFAEHVDHAGVAREMTARWAEGMRRALAVRDSGSVPGDRFLDVDYRQLVRDPLAAVRRIYDHFGLVLGDEAERRMRRYVETNPKDKRGRHRYALEECGLDPDEERRRFAAYRERFHL